MRHTLTVNIYREKGLNEKILSRIESFRYHSGFPPPADMDPHDPYPLANLYTALEDALVRA